MIYEIYFLAIHIYTCADKIYVNMTVDNIRNKLDIKEERTITIFGESQRRYKFCLSATPDAEN